MSEVTSTSSRKSDHIRINLEKDVHSGLTTGLERYRFLHQALPEIDLDAVDLSLTIFNKRLRAPLLISSMTGGTDQAENINLTLAEAAQEYGIAMGLGSLRAGLDDPETLRSYKVRRLAPDILLLANIGAVQLNYSYTIDQCRRAVEDTSADGLILHLNALQESLQPEGNTRFSGLLKKIEGICHAAIFPVLVKEVGWGISGSCARQLADAGVAAIDVAGAGGTSWSQVEMHRIEDENLANVAAAFRDWGIPTADCIRQIREAVPDMLIFASGGIRNGIDICKCIALGAKIGGMAGPFLKAAAQSPDALNKLIFQITREIRICMFAAGAIDLPHLQITPLVDIYTP